MICLYHYGKTLTQALHKSQSFMWQNVEFKPFLFILRNY